MDRGRVRWTATLHLDGRIDGVEPVDYIGPRASQAAVDCLTARPCLATYEALPTKVVCRSFSRVEGKYRASVGYRAG
jgi:hypothetical protein